MTTTDAAPTYDDWNELSDRAIVGLGEFLRRRGCSDTEIEAGVEAARRRLRASPSISDAGALSGRHGS